MGVTGNPIAFAAGAAARNTFESAPVKTALAATFKNSDKAASALNSLSPGARGVILEFISSLNDEDTPDNQNQ